MKLIKRITLFIATICFTITAANAQNYILIGTVNSNEPLPSNQFILQGISPYGATPIDTVTLDEKGNFAFKGQIDEKAILFISFGNYKNIYMVVDNTTNNKLDVTIDGDQITYSAQKGTETNELSKIANLLSEFNKKYLALNAIYGNKNIAVIERNNAKAQMDIIKGEWDEKQTNQLKQTNSLLASIFAIEMLQVQADKATEEQNLAIIAKETTPNRWYDFYKPKAQQRLKTAVGAKAPNFTLQTPKGDTLSLEDLKGQYVLVDFWASWCRPCRAVNPYLVSVYNQYKDKGIEFLGVSLDKTKPKWEAAIAQDGLTWKHVSDLRGWQSYAAKLYGVNSIPANILLDKNGVIVAKNLHGVYLGKKIDSVLKSN